MMSSSEVQVWPVKYLGASLNKVCVVRLRSSGQESRTVRKLTLDLFCAPARPRRSDKQKHIGKRKGMIVIRNQNREHSAQQTQVKQPLPAPHQVQSLIQSLLTLWAGYGCK